MKIVHVTRQFHPARGGLESVVDNLASQQAVAGHSVRVVTLNRIFGADQKLAACERRGGFEIVRIPFFGSQRYPIAPSVLGKIRSADLVHVHAIDFFFDFLALTKPVHRKPLVVSTHGGFFHTGFAARLKRHYFNTVTRRSLRHYGFVAASSEQDRRNFSRIRQRGIEAVGAGVDCKRFAGAAGDAELKRIIYFGRLAPNKNLAALFPFLTALRVRDPVWKLTIAGRPMADDIARLDNAIARAGLWGHVKLIESPSDEILREAIGECSTFVSPSDYEGFGVAAIEAMSAGLLTVLSDIPAHRDTVRATGLGLLVDFQQPEAAADAMLAARRSRRPDREDIARRLEAYSWGRVAERFDEIYSRVVGLTERRILGARVQVSDMEAATARIDECVVRRQPLRVAFVNANLANEAANDRAVGEALEGFHLLNDGIGLDLASLMLFGRFFPANLNGTDFTPAYLDRSRLRLRLFLLGSDARVVAKAADLYAKRWPRHEVVGYCHAYFGEAEAAALAERVRAARADVVLAAMGNPRQELWLARYVPEACPVGIAVGALFNFQTGQIPRAPEWIRKMRLEWVFRLLSEPRRLWRRYTVGNAVFLTRVAMQLVRGERA
jgi:alpha-1,3-mannosyltransferase